MNLLYGLLVMLACLLLQACLLIVALRFYGRHQYRLAPSSFSTALALVGGVMLVLVAGTAAGVLYCVLVRFERPANRARSGGADADRLETLSVGMVDEMQRLHPFIHHHRSSGGPRFRMAMVHLKRHLYGKPD